MDAETQDTVLDLVDASLIAKVIYLKHFMVIPVNWQR
jgi:hypothetical protein